MTTMEAIARALGLLEGPAVRDALLAPLRLMTQHQAQWSPAVRQRLQKGIDQMNAS